MTICTEIGRWIEENIEEPLERFFEAWLELCEEIRRWVEEEIRRPIEVWREQQERRCREEKCYWLCLCCNKLICWFITTLVKVIEWVIEIVGEWLVETICKLVAIIIRVIVMVIVTILKWIVIAIICILEALCAAIMWAAALAILFALVSIAAIPIPVLMLMTWPVALAAIAAAITALLVARFLCQTGWCKVIRYIGWAFKWATILSALMALVFVAIGTGMFMAIYGGIVAAIMIALEPTGCKLPGLFERP